MAQRKARVELFEPVHNVSLWLHRIDTERQLRTWPDPVAVAEASLLMTDVPLTWFLTHCNEHTTWADFSTGMKHRFGDSEQTVTARIQHRKQHDDESVQSYADDMNMMFSQSVFPEPMKRDLLLENLKPALRKQVITSIPKTMDEVINNARFLEEKANGVTPEKLKQWEQQHNNSKGDQVDRLTKAMDKMSIAFANRQEFPDRAAPNRQPFPPPRPPDVPIMQCWKCQGMGHRAVNCPNQARTANYARANLLESHTQASYERAPDFDDYTPSTAEARVYAAGGRTGPLQRTPKNRTPWTPEGIQAARDARTNRGNAAASGSGATPTPAPAPRLVPGHRTYPDPGTTPAREYRRSHKAVDIMSQLDNTLMKITYGGFLREAPGCCADLIEQLGGINKGTFRAPANRTAAAPRATPATPPPVPRPFPTARTAVDSGPVPMETTFESEAFYHAKPQVISNINAVVRAEVDILGKAFECIVDTGASDTVLSHSVVRRLGLMDRLLPSQISFLTAAGKTEKPMGMLPSLPITLGSLSLHIDCMVTKANNYNVLVGNDWLRMAGADLLLSSGVLRVRLGPDQYEDIQIDTDGGVPKVHMCQTGGEAVRQAVQCLEEDHYMPTIEELTDSDTESVPDMYPGSDAEDIYEDIYPDSSYPYSDHLLLDNEAYLKVEEPKQTPVQQYRMTSKLSDIDSRASWGSGPAPEFDLFPDEDDHDYASRQPESAPLATCATIFMSQALHEHPDVPTYSIAEAEVSSPCSTRLDRSEPGEEVDSEWLESADITENGVKTEQAELVITVAQDKTEQKTAGQAHKEAVEELTQGVAVSPFLPLSTIQVDGAEEAEVKTEAPALPTEVTTSRGHRLLTLRDNSNLCTLQRCGPQCEPQQAEHYEQDDFIDADALSRSPIAAALQTAVATIAVVDTQPFQFDSDEDGDRVTYASCSEEHLPLPEGGSDSGPSVPEELACEVCASPGGDEAMLLCDNCNKGTHATCLTPPLSAVPKGVWLCVDCEEDVEASPQVIDLTNSPVSTDITQDLPTLQYLKTGTFLQLASEQEKTRIRAKSQRYIYQGNQLFHKASGKPIPRLADRPDIIAQSHSYGHYGIEKTTNIVQNHYWWWGMKDQVKEHLKTCDPCKMGLAKFNEPVEMQPIAVQGIYHKVGIDMIGPLQTSKSGHKYIITAVDYMSKNIEAQAVANKSSKTTAEFFYRDIVCRHGTPVEVVTDQGGEFQGEFQALLDKCGIDHRLTSPYHPQANGLTERANQTLTRSLIKMTKEDPDNWDQQIPTILMGYRATRQASTKYSPFFMLHGHEMVLPINNKGRTVSTEHGELPESFAAELFGPSQAALDDALVNIEAAQDKQMATYAKKHLHGNVPTKLPLIPPETAEDAAPSESLKTVHIPKTTKTGVDPAVITIKTPVAVNLDLPSSSTEVSKVAEPEIVVKQEVTTPVPTNPPEPQQRIKRLKKSEIKEGDFIVAKIHKMVRTEGNRKGKLVPKAEGPYLVTGFTDESKQMAIIADANNIKWTKRVADLSLWE